MSLKSQAGNRAALDGLNALANGGTLRIYSGAVPATADEALGAQEQQATVTLSGAAFGAATGTTTATAALAGVPLNTTVTGGGGLVTFARIIASDTTTVVAQYTVGILDEDIIFPTATWVAGGNVSITGLNNTLPL